MTITRAIPTGAIAPSQLDAVTADMTAQLEVVCKGFQVWTGQDAAGALDPAQDRLVALFEGAVDEPAYDAVLAGWLP